MTTTLRVDIFSDIICPWCLIGYHRLSQAVDSEPDIDVDIHWLPFELNPDMPAEGMNRRAYLEAKFGGPDGAERVYGRIASVLDEEGIEHDLSAIRRTPSTLAAHRLLALAEILGRGTELKRRLFGAYFREGRDIGRASVLLDCARDVGMDSEQARDWLDGDDGLEHVRSLEADARRLGIQGVPHFILERKWSIPGAQPVDVMRQALREVAARS